MNNKFNYTTEEVKLFRKLNTPAKIQDFLNTLPFNFEKRGETYRSPREMLKYKTAHCMEGALFAAAVLEFHGEKPLILDLRATNRPYDDDHVVALFKGDGWGAISKTNHAVLRYREPIYSSPRELAASYFHEYFLHDGRKTLREYSEPFDLSKLKLNWRTSPEYLFEIQEILDASKHYSFLNKKQLRNLRRAEKIEREAGKLMEWKNK